MVTRAAVEPADDAAARLDRDLAAAVLDRERAVAAAQAGDDRNREPEREQRKEDKGLPHHAPSIGTQRVPRVIFM